MKLIVGLGNPGPKYVETRHNIGFRAVEALAGKLAAREMGRRWHSVVARATVGEEEIYIIKPQTYMNNSGRAIIAAVSELNPSNQDIIIVYDDIALPLGTLRFRLQGSAGGQKGMASIIDKLGHQDVPRLRLGVGADTLMQPREFVLDRFARGEMKLVEIMLEQSSRALEFWIQRGTLEAMNSFNGPVTL